MSDLVKDILFQCIYTTLKSNVSLLLKISYFFLFSSPVFNSFLSSQHLFVVP